MSELIWRDDIVSLARPGGIGIELGVAEGDFSARVLAKRHFSHFYSVDMWAGDRGHNDAQYRRVLARLEQFKDRNTIIRMTFEETLPLFVDQYFDFIYIDGYAHDAQQNGKTLSDWWDKLAPGGIFAGDDYHPDFLNNQKAIDRFIDSRKLKLNIINCREPGSVWSEYPTWYTQKE